MEILLLQRMVKMGLAIAAAVESKPRPAAITKIFLGLQI